MRVAFEKHNCPYLSIESPNLSFYPHLHPQIELLFVEFGIIDVCVDGERSTLNQGDLLVVFPNLIHSYQTKGDSLCHLLIFQLDYIREYTTQLTTMKPRESFLHTDLLHKDVPEIIYMLRSSTFSDNHLLKGYLLVLMGHILEKLPLVQTETVQDTSLLSKVLVYLEQHYTDDIQLETVARALGVSKYSISRCFSQNVGTNFNHYINALRIQHAQTLLLQTDMPIVEIGFAVGFESISTFYRSFKAIVGEKPIHYRHRIEPLELDN